MDPQKSQQAPDCPVGCPTCPASQHADGRGAPAVRGPRLAVLSLIVFLAPLALAVAGAAVAGGSGGRQLLGAVCGLAAGIAAAVLARGLLAPRGRDAAGAPDRSEAA